MAGDRAASPVGTMPVPRSAALHLRVKALGPASTARASSVSLDSATAEHGPCRRCSRHQLSQSNPEFRPPPWRPVSTCTRTGRSIPLPAGAHCGDASWGTCRWRKFGARGGASTGVGAGRAACLHVFHAVRTSPTPQHALLDENAEIPLRGAARARPFARRALHAISPRRVAWATC